MTAKLFSEMMNLKDHVRPFPILDYKISSNETTILENKRNYSIYKLIRLKQDKLIFQNSSNKIIQLL